MAGAVAPNQNNAGLENTMKQEKIKWIGNLLTIAALWFLTDFFRKLEIDWQALLSIKILSGIFVGGAVSFCSVLLSAWAWKNTVAFFSEKKIPFPEAAKVYMQANLGKYLPGNIAHFVERSMFAAKAGMGHAQTVMGTFLEIAGLFAAAAVAGMALSFQDVCLLVRAFFSVKYAAGIAVLFITGSLVLWLLYQKLAWVRIFFHKMKQAAFWKVFCLNLLFYLWALLLLAGLMCLFVWMLNDTAPAAWQVRKIMNVYILSWAAGFVIPGAPGGIGVREVVITYLTRNDPIQEAVLLAMVVHRISTVLGDLFGYLWAKCGLLL